MPGRADGPGSGRGPGDAGGGTACEAARDRLDAWLDGELAAPAADALQAHLDACAGCRDELALARRLREALGGELPMLACPPEVTDRVLEAVAEDAGALGGEGAGGAAEPSRGLDHPEAPEAPTTPPGRERRHSAGQAAGLWDRLAALGGRLGGAGALRPALVAATLLLLLVAAPLLYRAVIDPDDAAPGRSEAPPATAEVPEHAPETQYTPEEVARAEEEARRVLAYVAAVGREAGQTVQEEVFAQGLGRPARRVLEGLEGSGLGVAAPTGERTAEGPRREP